VFKGGGGRVYVRPTGDLDFEAREIGAVEGGEHGYEADDADDTCTA
jgi:hypothetical protein